MSFRKGEPLGKEPWSSGQVCVLAGSLERIKPVISVRLLSFWLLCRRPPPGAQGLGGRARTGGWGLPHGGLDPKLPTLHAAELRREATSAPLPFALLPGFSFLLLKMR